jgi:hypothetical protein
LTLDSNNTYTNENLTLVVGNNGDNSPKLLNIYGLKRDSSLTIFSSFLSSTYGSTIGNLSFGDKDSIIVDIDSEYPIIVEDIKVKNLTSGKYNGFLYLKGEELFNIPVTISTTPKVTQAIILVVIGVLIAIVLWELYFLSNHRDNNNKVKAQNILANNAASAFARSSHELKMEMYQKRAESIENRYLFNSTRIISVEMATVAFGILTGLLGIASNSFVTTLIEINELDFAILIGMGMGIGSLKGIVEKKNTS